MGARLCTLWSRQVPRMAQQEQGQDGQNQVIIEVQPGGNSRATDDASPFATIKRVPDKSRALHRDRYEPCHVSIGPYHRSSCKRCSTVVADDDKEKYLRKFFLRALSLKNGESSGTKVWKAALATEISKQFEATAANKLAENGESSGTKGTQDSKAPLVPEITIHANNRPEGTRLETALVTEITSQRYYDYADDSCPRNVEDFAKMLLLDGCYLVVAIFKDTTEYPQGSTSRDLMLRDTWYILENQIPFFVLEEIYARVMSRCTQDARKDFTVYAYRLLETQRMCIPIEEHKKKNLKPPETIHHLLHLLHTFLEPHNKLPAEPETESEPNKTKARQWHRATDYRKYANIEFKGRQIGEDKVDDVRSVLDVRYEGRHGKNIVIPCLRVDGNTWTILLNLMALEGQDPRLGTHVTAYCLFMSQIACTKEDVELLEAQGVIDRHLRTPESVAAGFSELCDAAVLDRGNIKKNYLKPLWHHLDGRYMSKRQNFRAWLCLNYFNWREATVLLGVFSAFILLVGGTLGAVYQVVSYYLPHH